MAVGSHKQMEKSRVEESPVEESPVEKGLVEESGEKEKSYANIESCSLLC